MKNNSFLGWIILVALLIFGLTCSTTIKAHSYYQQDNSYERALEIRKYVSPQMVMIHSMWNDPYVGPAVKNKVRDLAMELYGINEVGFELLIEEIELYEKYFKQEYNEKREEYLEQARRQ